MNKKLLILVPLVLAPGLHAMKRKAWVVNPHSKPAGEISEAERMTGRKFKGQFGNWGSVAKPEECYLKSLVTELKGCYEAAEKPKALKQKMSNAHPLNSEILSTWEKADPSRVEKTMGVVSEQIAPTKEGSEWTYDETITEEVGGYYSGKKTVERKEKRIRDPRDTYKAPAFAKDGQPSIFNTTSAKLIKLTAERDALASSLEQSLTHAITQIKLGKKENKDVSADVKALRAFMNDAKNLGYAFKPTTMVSAVYALKQANELTDKNTASVTEALSLLQVKSAKKQA